MLAVKRKVRSAGRTSGSIEITLPPEMDRLEGIECRLILRDGARPEIVIQPDISIAEIIFEELWERLRIGLHQIRDIGSFNLADFNVSFLPPRHWHERPPLSYRDAIAIYRANQGQLQLDRSDLSHVITFLAVGAAYRLGLEDRYALVFGVIIGYLVSGISAGHGTDFEQDAALEAFQHYSDPALFCTDTLFKTKQWEEAQNDFRCIYDQVWRWQSNPDAYEVDRHRWWEKLELSTKEWE